ncbi:MAG: ATP-binding cassette domain-containing protein [Hyphomicrobiaceae bacterium]|nr:ATP-binding cassette domain-containing protein [Hyphomicrobiaceae bacterium]
MSKSVIEVAEATKTFMISAGFMRGKMPLHAVNGVSIDVQQGEVLGIVGESGCGKTTLARMMLGLLDPTSGAIKVNGQPVDNVDRLEVARQLQPIFQDPYSSLNPRKSIGDIVTLPLKVQGDPDPDTWKRRAEEMMEMVGLPSRVYNNFPSQLSGGQRQRVAIARALINRPEIVICDEPTSALDVSVQSQILNLLQDLRKEFGLTYIIISHNLAVVEHMATRVAVMYLGRVVEQADTETLFKSPKHPYTEALLGSVLTPVPGLGVPDTHLGAAYPNPIDPPSGCTFHPRCAKVMDCCSKQFPPTIPNKHGFVECHLYSQDAKPPKVAAKRGRAAAKKAVNGSGAAQKKSRKTRARASRRK